MRALQERTDLAVAEHGPAGADSERGIVNPDTMPGYGVPVGLGERVGGEQCPQCGESDLRPYGNGSKWACPQGHGKVVK